MVDLISTDARAEESTVAYWRRIMLERFGIEYVIDSDERVPFEAHMRFCRLGVFRLADQCGVASRMSRRVGSDGSLVTLVFQIHGDCVLLQDTHEIFLEPRHFCIYPYSGEAEFQYVGSYRQIFAIVNSRHLDKALPGWSSFMRKPVATSIPSGDLLLDMLQSACVHGNGLGSSLAFDFSALLMNLLGATMKAPEERSAAKDRARTRLMEFHRKRIKDFVLANLCDPELDIATICAGVNLSPRYVHHLFCREPMRLMEWVWDIRLERCSKALSRPEETHRSIKEVAYANGFNDQSHFSHAFRQRFGMSPRDFRGRMEMA